MIGSLVPYAVTGESEDRPFAVIVLEADAVLQIAGSFSPSPPAQHATQPSVRCVVRWAMGASERNDLLEVLDDRVGTRSTSITSQLPVEAWQTYRSPVHHQVH